MIFLHRSSLVHLIACPHAGPTLLTAQLSSRYYIFGCHQVVRSITRACVTCCHASAKPKPPILGQLPTARVSPDIVFDKIGINYAGPISITYGYVAKPTIVKAYVCVFVSLSVKAVHLEPVSDLTTEAFIASLRRFISKRGKPPVIWSDHKTNFVGAASELQDLFRFLNQHNSQQIISQFCSNQNIQLDFIPERAPHFGGLWEASVKSFKSHLKKITTNIKLTYEEFTTILTQIEACLNSRPLTCMNCNDDGIEALTPGHFLIGGSSKVHLTIDLSRPLTLQKRWHLCQSILNHFWKRWSGEFISSLQRYIKWNKSTRNIKVNDVVIVREDGLLPTKWAMARFVEVHPGQDGVVHVVTIKTSNGTYKRPVTKVAVLIPTDDSTNTFTITCTCNYI